MTTWCTAGRLLAAVRDFGMPCGHAALEQFGWRMDMPYFNAGLLLLDLKARLGSREARDFQETTGRG